jgi:uncharacterized membrane protein YbhN (UPF0104 family)
MGGETVALGQAAVHGETNVGLRKRRWMRNRKGLLLAAKVVISAVLLGLVFAKADLGSVYHRLASGRWDLIGLAFFLVLLSVPVVSMRWWLLLLASRAAGQVGFALTLRATFIGLFFGQILPGVVGGDAVRAWVAYRSGLRPGFVVSSVLVDRLSAVLGLVALGLVSFHLATTSGSRELWIAAAVAGGVLVGATAACIAFLPFLLGRLARRWDRLHQVFDLSVMVRKGLLSGRGAVAIGISTLGHVLTTYAVTVTGAALSIPTRLEEALAVVPLSLLISAIPISVAGWGLREATMVLGFGAFGMQAEDAAILSIWLGLSVLLSSLPGGVLWLMSRPAPSGC